MVVHHEDYQTHQVVEAGAPNGSMLIYERVRTSLPFTMCAHGLDTDSVAIFSQQFHAPETISTNLTPKAKVWALVSNTLVAQF